MPPVSSEDTLELHESVIDEILQQLKSYSNTNQLKDCDWCEKNEWGIDPTVYTDTVFDLPGDRHVHTKVSSIIRLQCGNCGNTKRFRLKKFGYSTKGGVHPDAE